VIEVSTPSSGSSSRVTPVRRSARRDVARDGDAVTDAVDQEADDDKSGIAIDIS